MDTHHTVMREEFSLVNARMYGPTRTSATIQAALLAMGTDPGVLVLMEEEGGVWTLDADILIPATVTLSIPAGVTVTGPANLTILGGLAAWRLDWYQGTGTVVWTGSAAPQISATLHAGALALGGPVTPLVTLRATGSAPWTLTLPPGPGTAQQVLTTNGAGLTSWVTVQAADSTLQVLAGLPTAPDTAPYFTATDEAALMTVTPLARQFLDDASIAAMQATLQVQPVDATLTGLAGITTSANLLPYLAGTDQWATCVLSPYARTLFDDTDAPTMRGTLNLGALSTLSTVTTPYITDGAVTLPKLADIPDARLLGRASGNAGPVQTLSVGAGLLLTGGMLQLAGGAIVGTGAANRLGVWSSAGNLSYAEGLQLILPAGQLIYSRVLNSGLASGTILGTLLALDITLDAASTAMTTGLRVTNTYRPNGFNGTSGWEVTALAAHATTFGTLGGTIGGLKGLAATAEHSHSGKVTQLEGLHVYTVLTGGGTLDYSHGILIDHTAMGAIQTTGIYSNVPAGTGRWNLYMPGTALNYLAGSLGIGTQTITAPLTLSNALGPKIDLWHSVGAGRYGLGIQSQVLQIYADSGSQVHLGNMAADGTTFTSRLFVGASGIGMTVPLHAAGTSYIQELGVQRTPEPASYAFVTNGGHFYTLCGFEGPVNMANTLGVVGAVNLYSTLVVYGATTLSPLTVNGNTSMNNPLTMRFTKQTQWAIQIWPTDNDTGGGGNLLFLNLAGTPVGTVQSTVNATYYNTSSDRRLKEQVEPLPDALTTVQALRPVRFRWKSDGSVGHGLIAQEVQVLVEGVVSGHEDDPLPLQIDYSKLVPWLIGAVQDLAHQVTSLQAAVTALRGIA